jgi:ABC-type branched-subunit amino acid transport system substrate-binding protein
MELPLPSPIRVGLLFDFPQADGGASIEEAVRLGLATSSARIDRPVEFIRHQARGLPLGTAADVEAGFGALRDDGVLLILGPTISDNGLIVRDLADQAGLPCINFTGGERTRSEFMFHYQVGSLAEEPLLLAELLAHRGLVRPAVVYDRSPVGRQYAEAFDAGAARHQLSITASTSVSPVSSAVDDVVAGLRSSAPDAVVYLGLGMAARTLAVALHEAQWNVPVVANSALMFGYARPDWRADWEGWAYVDSVADDNEERQQLKSKAPAVAAGPMGVATYDAGRIMGEALARTDHLTRSGVKEALEDVKRLPAATGSPGTTMGFGCWDHGALKGPFLVLRVWEGGRTVPYSS